MRSVASGWDVAVVIGVGLLAAAWAVVLGYSQQLLTRFVDQRAQTVLDNFGRPAAERREPQKAIDLEPVSA
jgi:hypothetical protein